jgi:hypothetical protein
VGLKQLLITLPFALHDCTQVASPRCGVERRNISGNKIIMKPEVEKSSKYPNFEKRQEFDN